MYRSILFVSVMTLFVTGCSSEGNPGVIPESPKGADTHAAIENPAGVKEKPKVKKKAANELPPQPPK
ncbi:hypothetical protein GC170_14325 [bacterium]|nr:hypothetical protein [bacterium]